MKKFPRYCINKQLVFGEIGDSVPKVSTFYSMNPYLDEYIALKKEGRNSQIEWKEPMTDYSGDPVASVEFNQDGLMIFFYSKEFSFDEYKAVNDYNPKRFENHFINFPNPFEKGDKVQMYDAKPNDECGYVDISKEDWDTYLNLIEKGLYVDFSDSTLLVVFTDSDDEEEKFKAHEHIMPIYLEKVE